jgi:3-oxoacyl-[acyl-carrier-protein] synthase III
MYARIVGTGGYLPSQVVTNFDLEKRMDTSDAWIRERTGIERRHYLPEGQSNIDMAEQAALAALRGAGLKPTDVDLISFGTTTPDLVFPNAGALLQARLGCRGVPAFSLEAACSGFIYALAMADKFVRSGESKCALVVGSEVLSRILEHRHPVWRRRRRGGSGAFRRAGHHFDAPALGR